MKKLLLPGILFTTLSAGAQLYIDNATFFIDNGAVVTVQGDVFSNTNILVNGAAGTGKLRMGGSANQNLNMNGNTVPNLQVDNSGGNVVLTGAAKVSNLLEFTTGKLQLGNFDLTLAAAGTHTGAGGTKFAETNGTGVFKKGLDVAGATVIPVGNASTYTPVNFTAAGGTYVAGTSFVAARAVGAAHPNKHPRSTDFLKNYWKLSNNIVGATITAVGNYLNPASVTGNQADIVSLYYKDTKWVRGTSQAATSVTAPVAANSSEDLYGMNKFIVISPKIFLLGTFNTSTGLMNDLLRTNAAYVPGALPASNLLPTSDPYRNAPYSTAFTHVANTVAEAITAPSVFNDLANPENQIVDWVFVELRNKTNNTTAPVIQTRSVLVQRDGDLVDIDGTSPVYFKNVDSTANYVVSARHRNHLGLSSNPASPLSIGLNPVSFDATNTAATASLYGTAGVNYSQAGTILKNVLWPANANFNANVRYTGLANDKDYLLLTQLGGNAGAVLSNVYNAADLNMNRTVRYTGLANDKDYLYLTILGAAVGAVKNQLLPAN